MQDGQYIWNENDEEYWNNDSFDTIEEALKDAKTNTNNIKGVYIGQVRNFVPRVKADDVIEQIQEDAYELVGDVSENYFSKVSKEHEEELNKTLTMVFNIWAEKYGYTPDFYYIDKIKFVKFEKE